MAHMRKFFNFSMNKVPLFCYRLRNEALSAAVKGRRHLFSEEILGMESFRRQRIATLEQIGGAQGKEDFKSTLDESKSNIVFTEDLKSVIYMTETEEDLTKTLSMVKNYEHQNRHNYSTFTFGPVVMRLFYYLRQPDLALQSFKDESLQAFFEQMSSYLVLMDLLFIENRHADVLDMFSSLQEKYEKTAKFPNSCTTLAFASLFKMGTPESFNRLVTLLKELKESNRILPIRALSFAAYSAIKQGKPDTALEIIADESCEKYISLLNIKAMAEAYLGEVDNSIASIASLLYKDVPDYIKIRQEIFPETISQISKAVKTMNKSDVTHKYETVLKDLDRKQHLTSQSFEDFILEPIVRKQALKGGFKYRQRTSMQRQSDFIRGFRPRKRLGITDID